MIDIRDKCPIQCLAHDNKDYTCNRFHCLKWKAYILGKAEAYEEMCDKIDEGVCVMCEYDSPTCHNDCGLKNWNFETLLKWAEKKKNEYNDD